MGWVFGLFCHGVEREKGRGVGGVGYVLPGGGGGFERCDVRSR